MRKAAIFDLDGTLLDSVDLHALAWHEAMTKFGHDVSFEQARGQIGKGGDKLIQRFCGPMNSETTARKWRNGAASGSRPSTCRLCAPFPRSPICSDARAMLA
jgi:beta-phosphoglucomutase-like phosphatase (HAD superfamily)